MMQGLVYLLAGEENAHSEAFDEPDGPRLAVSVDAPCEEWVRGVFELAKACFVLLAERYPENVRFADVSRRGKESMMDLQLFAEGEAAPPALSEAQTRQAVASGTMKPDEAKAPAVPQTSAGKAPAGTARAAPGTAAAVQLCPQHTGCCAQPACPLGGRGSGHAPQPAGF